MIVQKQSDVSRWKQRGGGEGVVIPAAPPGGPGRPTRDQTPHARPRPAEDIDGLRLSSWSACEVPSSLHNMAVQDRSKSAEVALPPIAALFLVVFDRKVGCVIECTLDKQFADDRLGTQ
jgi:hypothetical protein